jgi:DNA-binding HxlR family transcriptional regulator
MRRKDFSNVECSIARAVDEVCEPWTLLVLRHAFLGARRFGEFETALGIPPTTLARRLTELAEKGLLEPRQYAERPPRFEYELTDKALDLFPVLVSLAVWGSRWKAPHGPPFDLVDADSGKRLTPMLVDRRSGKPLGPGDVALSPGSGASAALKRRIRATGKQRLVFGRHRHKIQSTTDRRTP